MDYKAEGPRRAAEDPRDRPHLLKWYETMAISTEFHRRNIGPHDFPPRAVLETRRKVKPKLQVAAPDEDEDYFFD